MIADAIFDAGLALLDNVENLYLCSAEPTTFTEASSTFLLGTKATPSIGAATNGATDGRRRVVAAITDGVVNSNGTATHWALTDDSASTLLAAGPLSSSQALTTGNPFSTSAFDVGIRDAVTQA